VVDRLSEAARIFVLALPPADPVLQDLARHGWLTVHGGSAAASVVTLNGRPPLGAVAPEVSSILAGESLWLAAHARNNVLAPVPVITNPAALAAWRQALLDQRTHAGRLEIAMALYVYALEAPAPAAARDLRGAVRGFGSLANFLGDDGAIGFVSDARHQLLRRNLAALAAVAAHLPPGLAGVKPLGEALDRLFGAYFTAA
jgi:hypothetical protein